MHNPYLLQSVDLALFKGGRVLFVRFVDGAEFHIDLAPLPDLYAAFAPLRHEHVFAKMNVLWGALEWPDEIDLSPGSLRAWCEAGRVLTPEETDEWIAKHTRQIEAVA